MQGFCRASRSDSNGRSIFSPPTLECRTRERDKTAIHSHSHWTILSPLYEVDLHHRPSNRCTGTVNRAWIDNKCMLRPSKVHGRTFEAELFTDAKSAQLHVNAAVLSLWILTQRAYCGRTLAQCLEPQGPRSLRVIPLFMWPLTGTAVLTDTHFHSSFPTWIKQSFLLFLIRSSKWKRNTVLEEASPKRAFPVFTSKQRPTPLGLLCSALCSAQTVEWFSWRRC